MSDLSVNFSHSLGKIMSKFHKIKSNQRPLRKNEVDTYGPPVFAPDYSATGLATEILTPMNVLCIIDFYV